MFGDAKAKYVFSIHLNSIKDSNSLSGVEIYAPPKVELNLAKAFADNIVKYAKTQYSNLEVTYKQKEGVYVSEAEAAGYEPYNVTSETPYLYMIRETGGIATKAYVDGRNTSYGKNKYYNSNIGVEAYLLELGYINNDTDLAKLLNEQDDYVKAIVTTIQEELRE